MARFFNSLVNLDKVTTCQRKQERWSYHPFLSLLRGPKWHWNVLWLFLVCKHTIFSLHSFLMILCFTNQQLSALLECLRTHEHPCLFVKVTIYLLNIFSSVSGLWSWCLCSENLGQARMVHYYSIILPTWVCTDCSSQHSHITAVYIYHWLQCKEECEIGYYFLSCESTGKVTGKVTYTF